MNVTLNPLQSNTGVGTLTLATSVDLTGKENCLLKIVNDSGTPKFALPTAVTDIAPFICARGGTTSDNSVAETPWATHTCRIKLFGTCVPGDKLCLNSDSYGSVYVPAGSAGSLLVEYIALEPGVSGQYVLCVPIPPRLVTF